MPQKRQEGRGGQRNTEEASVAPSKEKAKTGWGRWEVIDIVT